MRESKQIQVPMTTSIRCLPARSIMRVRSWAPANEMPSVIALAAGQGWPVMVGRATAGEPRALCVGPADWLVTALDPEADSTMLASAVSDRLCSATLVSVDLTDALAVLELCGEAAREMLAGGCGIDLHPASYGPECCARTRLAQIPVVIDCREAQRFELYVARSYASYLESWLADAALSHG